MEFDFQKQYYLLKDIASDQDRRLKHAQEEIAILSNKSQENDMDIQNLNEKLRNLVNDINNTQDALNKNNAENRDLCEKIKNLECQCANLKCENKNLNNNIMNERACRTEKERQNKNLTDCINEHDIQIEDLTNKFNALNDSFNQASNESKDYQVRNSKFKQHIMTLTQQNQKLLGELENVKEQDYKLKTLFGRKEQSSKILGTAHNCIEKATLCLGKVENDPLGCCNSPRNSVGIRHNSSEKHRNSSPRYNYQKIL